MKLTSAQRTLLKHVADNPGRLRDSHSLRDFPKSVLRRRDVLDRVWLAGLIEPPRTSESRTWVLTDAGRAALERA